MGWGRAQAGLLREPTLTIPLLRFLAYVVLFVFGSSGLDVVLLLLLRGRDLGSRVMAVPTYLVPRLWIKKTYTTENNSFFSNWAEVDTQRTLSESRSLRARTHRAQAS